MSNAKVRRIAVLGGGITGLAAAYTLAQARRAGAPIEEFLIEAGQRLGGVIRTETVNGFVIEGGPDSFLAEKPEAAALCRELGLGGSLIGSNDLERRTYILHRRRLVPLPDGFILFVPTQVWSVFTTPLLPLASKTAIVADWFRRPIPASQSEAGGRAAVEGNPDPSLGVQTSRGADSGHTDGRSARVPADESVASFVSRHFGQAMVENIADPLLAGVFGGDSARLSVRSVLPRFCEMEERFGSLSRGVLAARKQRIRSARLEAESEAAQGDGPRSPLFLTLKKGLESLVRALASRLEAPRVHLGRRVIHIERKQRNAVAGDTGEIGPSAYSYELRCEGGVVWEVDALILALPTHQCSGLLRSFDATLAAELSAIPYTSALTVSLGYGPGVRDKLPAGFGFLVPRKEHRRLLACTFVHSKFRHRAPDDRALLRCFLGGARDPEVLRLSDDEILGVVRRELSQIVGLEAEAEFSRVFRWPSSMPQYEVGHAARINAIERCLESHPGLYLAGSAYSGIGISDCIRTGRSAAQRALEMVTPRQS